jgi:C4-type Zn-finger protein
MLSGFFTNVEKLLKKVINKIKQKRYLCARNFNSKKTG